MWPFVCYVMYLTQCGQTRRVSNLENQWKPRQTPLSQSNGSTTIQFLGIELMTVKFKNTQTHKLQEKTALSHAIPAAPSS